MASRVTALASQCPSPFGSSRCEDVRDSLPCRAAGVGIRIRAPVRRGMALEMRGDTDDGEKRSAQPMKLCAVWAATVSVVNRLLELPVEFNVRLNSLLQARPCEASYVKRF